MSFSLYLYSYPSSSRSIFTVPFRCHNNIFWNRDLSLQGIKKFAYDIWGDTVNTASRMESSGAPGKVNICGSTHELVKDNFECTHRGKIDAKNKGQVDMYFVESPKAV